MALDTTSGLSSAEQSQLRKTLSSPAILTNGVSGFIATINTSTGGVDVTFLVASITGISAITLLRNYVQDIGTAMVLNTWSAPQAMNYIWSDTDATLQTYGQAYYWLTLSPVGASGTAVNVGPQNVVLNPDLTAPTTAFAISASHAAAVSGTVLVTVNVSGGPTSGTLKIYVTGYQGVFSPVAVAQSAMSPIQFALQDTGETVTFTAETVSSGGVESTGGPTTTLTLNSTETVPAEPLGVTVAALASGNQVSWPANIDDVTSYAIWRGLRGAPFSSATLLTTVSPSGGKIMQYLDTAGLTGDYAYFIVAANGIGSSTPSDGASVVLIPASSVIYQDGSTAQSLQPKQVGADHTLNHVVISSIAEAVAFPGVSAMTEVSGMSWSVIANDPSDTFQVLASIMWSSSTSSADIQFVGVADGLDANQFGYGLDFDYLGNVLQYTVTPFFGSITGLSAGTHIITIYYYSPNSAPITIAIGNSIYGTLTQISS